MTRSSVQQQRSDQDNNCAAGESTIVSHLFEGQLSYMTLCMHCDHQAHSTQTFTILSLPIPRTIKCSIQVLFNSCRWMQLLYCTIKNITLHACHILDSDGLCLIVLCCLTFIPSLCGAGLSVSVFRAHYPDRWRADAVFNLWAKERNCSRHLFGQTSWDPHVAPETVGTNIISSV